MGFLTDRSLATGVTLQDLIHIVITGDTSQGNFAGSSYKATIQQVSDALLPVFTGTSIYEVGSGTDSTQRIGVGADASGDYSLVGGGTGNTASGNYSFVGGGSGNTANFILSNVVGGVGNTASCYHASVLSGIYNRSIGFGSTVSGGYKNTSKQYFSFIGGGEENIIYDNLRCNSSIVGGASNFIDNGNLSFIGGGLKNTILVDQSFIGGGSGNTVSCQYSFIGGGIENNALGLCSIIGGGVQNSTISTLSTIVGGVENKTNCNYSSILGGSGNTVSHCFSSAVGCGVTSVSACTFHTNYLALQNTPVTDSTNNNVLVRDTSTGVVKTKNISTHNYGLFTQTGDSTTVTATVAETTIIGPGLGSLIVPANGFSVGDSFSLVIGGHISFNGADTLTVKVKSNSTTLASTGAINMQNSTNKHWQLKVDFTIRALGGLGVASIATLGSFSYVENAADKFDGYDISNVESSLFNTTISNTLDVTVQYSSTSATNNMYSEVMTLTKTY